MDFEFQVEQVFAEGFEDGQSLDLGEVQLALGDFEFAADFFLADDLRREQRTLGIFSCSFCNLSALTKVNGQISTWENFPSHYFFF